MSLRKNLLVGVAATLAALSFSAPAGAGSLSLSDDFESMSISTWSEGSTHGPWTTRFDGFGKVAVERAGSKVLMLRPQVSEEAGETHAALVTSKRTFSSMRLTARAKTVKQLRASDPNPWESAWDIWN